jgi:hypothetical protein
MVAKPIAVILMVAKQPEDPLRAVDANPANLAILLRDF